eukprot:1800079-Rhodomonas_salina.5
MSAAFSLRHEARGKASGLIDRDVTVMLTRAMKQVTWTQQSGLPSKPSTQPLTLRFHPKRTCRCHRRYRPCMSMVESTLQPETKTIRVVAAFTCASASSAVKTVPSIGTSRHAQSIGTGLH